jgi:hypothetical protein
MSYPNKVRFIKAMKNLISLYKDRIEYDSSDCPLCMECNFYVHILRSKRNHEGSRCTVCPWVQIVKKKCYESEEDIGDHAVRERTEKKRIKILRKWIKMYQDELKEEKMIHKAEEQDGYERICKYEKDESN